MSVVHVWVFNAHPTAFPGAVFSSRELAQRWIAKHRLSGTLAAYPLDKGVYEWAIECGYLTAQERVDAVDIARFTSASQERYHYDNGVLGGGE